MTRCVSDRRQRKQPVESEVDERTCRYAP
ncbi:Protein of unknown function [Thermobacillus xylanilyticus]|uniref:Uncharacterized protein n=1 Tax=Thermobacillus xylanilyticus TaxID=76633 RepID=A0ABM8V7Y6_THEXY|nr:Protein of unknown function [Thermobacillus xylanilyticus]